MDTEIREVWFQRHGTQEEIHNEGVWAPSARLTQEGHDLIRRVGKAYYSDVEFADCRHSNLVRAQETAALLYPSGPWVIEPRLGPTGDWEGVSHTLTVLHELYAEAPSLYGNHVRRAYNLIFDILQNLENKQRALLVGNNPLLSILLLAASEDANFIQTPWDVLFPKGGLLVLTYRGNMLSKLTQLLPPDP